jgi:DNA-binding protein HU-beta
MGVAILTEALASPILDNGTRFIQPEGGDTMSREELIAKAAADAGVQKTVAGAVLNSLLHSITGALKKGGKVSLVGFGTFSVGHRKARKGKIPGTNKEILIPAARVPKFKAGKNLKEAVAR